MRDDGNANVWPDDVVEEVTDWLTRSDQPIGHCLIYSEVNKREADLKPHRQVPVRWGTDRSHLARSELVVTKVAT